MILRPLKLRPWMSGCALAVFGLSAVLPRLGQPCLWEDEAETAVPARTILERGLPYAIHGDNTVTQEYGYDSNDQGIWSLSTWLSHYVMAVSFWLFGVNAWSARLPFALCGVGTALLLWHWLRVTTRDEGLALLAGLLLVANVPFLLYARQARYYALSALVSVGYMALYLDLLTAEPETAKRRAPLVGLAGGLLFHTNQLSWALCTAGLLSHAVVATRLVWRRLPLVICATSVMAALVAPWLVWQRMTGGTPIRWMRFAGGFATQYPLPGLLEAGQNLLCPLLLALAVGYTLAPRALRWRLLSPEGVSLAACFGASALLTGLLPTGVPAVGRYFAPLYPAAALVVASVSVRLWRHASPLHWAGPLLAGVLVLTNVGDLWLPWATKASSLVHFDPMRLRCYWQEYMGELTHDYVGPIDQLSSLIRQMPPGTRIFTSYEAEPLLFHTQASVERRLPFAIPPDLIVCRAGHQRDFGRVLLSSSWYAPERAEYRISWQRTSPMSQLDAESDYVWEFVQGRRYAPRRLGVDAPWQNRPELRYHRFRSATQGAPLTVWVRSGLLPGKSE